MTVSWLSLSVSLPFLFSFLMVSPLLSSRYFPAVQCSAAVTFRPLKQSKSVIGSVQEASQPFELHCVITAGTILMTVYPHGCSYCREIGVNNMIFQICEHFHWLCGSLLQDPFSLFTLKDTRIYKGIFLTGTHVQ